MWLDLNTNNFSIVSFFGGIAWPNPPSLLAPAEVEISTQTSDEEENSHDDQDVPHLVGLLVRALGRRFRGGTRSSGSGLGGRELVGIG